MHPAPSVILFSTLSGLGFGLLAWLGLGIPPVTGWVAFAFFCLAYALAVGGLLAATFHLANPKNALKSFSQWRSSWLSREGCLAVAALLIMAVYGVGTIFFASPMRLIGMIGALLSIGTVFTTSMIYAQLKTVPRWNHASTPALFLTLSIGGGALLSGQASLAGLILLIAGALQAYVWRRGDGAFAAAGHTLSTATGLGQNGKIRQFESPHTGSNYLLKEMAYSVGRKHAVKLRIIALMCMSLLPAALLLFLPSSHVLAGAAVLLHLTGTLCSRWLFFAEAEHVVGLYYGKHAD